MAKVNLQVVGIFEITKESKGDPTMCIWNFLTAHQSWKHNCWDLFAALSVSALVINTRNY